jgi:hypothetical protein
MLDTCVFVQWFRVALRLCLLMDHVWVGFYTAKLKLGLFGASHGGMHAWTSLVQRWQRPLHLEDKSEVDLAGWPFANQVVFFSPYTGGRIAGGERMMCVNY